MNEETISRFSGTQSQREVDCPRCKAKPNEHCHTPKGNLTRRAHTERIAAYHQQIGPQEYRARHSSMRLSLQDILSR